MKKFLGLTLVAIALLTFGAMPAAAQTPQPEQPEQPRTPPPGPPDLMDDGMFPPDMIMQHQRELALTDEQKTFMRSEIGKTSARFNDLQWQLHDAMEALHDTMKVNQINEQQALAQLDKVLDAEREIKKLHMSLAIRIKNALTPEQQEKLQNMRHGETPRRRHGPGAPEAPGAPNRRPPRPGEPGRPGAGPGGPGGPPRGIPF